jgi:hypothetical protein
MHYVLVSLIKLKSVNQSQTRNDKSAQTNRRNDKSALMSENQNIKYQQSTQNEKARFPASQSASKLQVL